VIPRHARADAANVSSRAVPTRRTRSARFARMNTSAQTLLSVDGFCTHRQTRRPHRTAVPHCLHTHCIHTHTHTHTHMEYTHGIHTHMEYTHTHCIHTHCIYMSASDGDACDSKSTNDTQNALECHRTCGLERRRRRHVVTTTTRRRRHERLDATPRRPTLGMVSQTRRDDRGTPTLAKSRRYIHTLSYTHTHTHTHTHTLYTHTHTL
jgi:hypothetical protein